MCCTTMEYLLIRECVFNSWLLSLSVLHSQGPRRLLALLAPKGKSSPPSSPAKVVMKGKLKVMKDNLKVGNV